MNRLELAECARGAERRSVVVAGVRTEYLEQGDGAETLVLLHGLVGCAATWLRMMECLPARFRVIAVDLAGAGGSERGEGIDAGLGAHAERVGLFLEAVGVERAVMVGHSHGGAVALRLAADRPELVERLVLMGPAHPYFRDADMVIRFYLSAVGRVFAACVPWMPRFAMRVGMNRMVGDPKRMSKDALEVYRANLAGGGDGVAGDAHGCLVEGGYAGVA